MKKKITIDYMGRKIKVSESTYRALKKIDLCKPTSEDLNLSGVGLEFAPRYDPVEESQII